MIPVPGVTIASYNQRVAITIPSTGATFRQIIASALLNWSNPILTILILGRMPDGTDRGSFVVADPRPGQGIQDTDYTIHGQHVAVGEDYTSPAHGDLDSYVKSGVDTNAVVVLFW